MNNSPGRVQKSPGPDWHKDRPAPAPAVSSRNYPTQLRYIYPFVNRLYRVAQLHVQIDPAIHFCASKTIRAIKKNSVYFILFIEIIRVLSADLNVIFLSPVVNILKKNSSQVNHS